MPAEQHVGGFHVPVDDPDGVRGAQRTDHGEADAGGLGGLEGTALEHLVQGLAAHQLHDDPGQSVLDDDIVDGDGGGMVDARGGPRLPMETVGDPLVGGVLRDPRAASAA